MRLFLRFSNTVLQFIQINVCFLFLNLGRFFLGRRRVGSFRFHVSDGLNKAENGQSYTFNIRVKDLSIHLDRHESLDVFPMMQATVRPDNLLVTTSDKQTQRPIAFLVKKPPKMGRLLLRVPSAEKVKITQCCKSHFFVLKFKFLKNLGNRSI